MDGSMVFVTQVAPVCTLPNIWFFFGPIQVQIPNGISMGSAVYAQLRAESRYTLQRAARFPLITAPSHGDLNPI